MEDDEEGMEINRQILKYLIKGKGKEGVDEQDNVNGSTPLMVACEHLTDLETFIVLVDGGAYVNAVNNDSLMPLSIINQRLEKDPNNAQLA